eukprot:1495962-Pleurochrysis_carterae.AAC.1
MRLPGAPAPGDYPLHPTAATCRLLPLPGGELTLTYLPPSIVAVAIVPFLYRRSQQRASPLAL